ncbi:hypothetical protein B0A48_12439 [Cryoendolithus antarcticus]|uniref:Alpha/beta hydrolase fold-3 domain-containing protein n=1 Tax=Cryoendolithus antarcticus TaxID=1507870 RepID=A0A1V8SS39_9PEZI|nr:hypothetical protein B0A48_12439 [Cryoendolithus antarcticus]
MAEIKDWKSLSEPTEEWNELLKSIGGQAPDLGMFPDIASMRTWITEAKKAMTANFEPVKGIKEEKDHEITVRDGSKITVRTYVPEKSGGPLAVIYHGGGFCIGGLENEELLCRNLCGRLGCSVVNVDYRLAPEHVFPAAAHDCWDATVWAADNATTLLSSDPSKGFIVAGTSAGGNLAAVVSHLAQDTPLAFPITGAHLMIPALCNNKCYPEKYKPDLMSYEQNKNAAILSEKAMDLFIDNYVPDASQRSNPLLSVLNWKSGHKGQPTTYFQICGADPLRDEAFVYERILRQDLGIKTKVDVYPGLPHGFWGVFPHMKSSGKFVEDSVKGAEWLLANGKA